MAFQPESKDHKCYLCGVSKKWFQMMESENPETHTTKVTSKLPDDEECRSIMVKSKTSVISQLLAAEAEEDSKTMEVQWTRHRVCPDCELSWRESEQSGNPGSKSSGSSDQWGNRGPEWATMPQVMKT